MLRLFMICGLAAGVWLGMKAERFLQQDRCLGAGGVVDTRGFCSGARP
ncbi:hypothetical protein GGR17_003338 [Confluentimicrobium naphthalenivorans]|jgi:hypothetical protein|uniref:Uncharacterized protein n=1 Tax=Actibacterium naphthalenivorans TaxID=1614693 RepID=A0A840CK04_9RHOB|nr:hypothetical protein [Actibacterium naphthalenivorans]